MYIINIKMRVQNDENTSHNRELGNRIYVSHLTLSEIKEKLLTKYEDCISLGDNYSLKLKTYTTMFRKENYNTNSWTGLKEYLKITVEVLEAEELK